MASLAHTGADDKAVEWVTVWGSLRLCRVVPFSSVMEKLVPGGYVGGRPKDESKLSRNPAQIRRRLRRSSQLQDGRRDRDIEMLYQKPISDWDIEELARGRPRNSVGDFRGATGSWITPAVQQEAKRRLIDETMGKLTGHLNSAIRAVGKLITSEEVDDKGKPIVDARTRLAAAQFVIEHVIGKPKALVEIEAADFTRKLIASAIVLDDGQPQDAPIVLEGSFTEPEGEDDDDA